MRLPPDGGQLTSPVLQSCASTCRTESSPKHMAARGQTRHAAAAAWRRRARCASACLPACDNPPRLTLVSIRSYARLDSWLASHAVPQSATAPASPAQPLAPQAASARLVVAPAAKQDAPAPANGAIAPDVALPSTLSVAGAAHSAPAQPAPMPTTHVVVLYLLWLLSAVIFATLAWAQVHR